jgi:transposase
MANTSISMNEVKQILLLYCQNTPIKQIARQLGMSRNTIKSYIKRFESSGLSEKDFIEMSCPELQGKLSSPSLSDDERYKCFVERAPGYLDELKTHRHLTKLLLWEEEFAANRTTYRYSQFCHHLLQFERNKSGTMVMNHIAGEKMFMDFAGDKLYYTDVHSGKLTPCEILLVTSGYSNCTRVVAILDQSLESTIDGLVQCFEQFGGVCKVLVPDNFKGAVTKANRYEPRINERFLDMANYYGVSVIPTRVAKPKDKPKVEAAVKHVYQRIYGALRHQSFGSLEELNQALKIRCDAFNARLMKDYGATRQELFDRDEKHHLIAIPQAKYELVNYHSLKVQQNNHVFLRSLHKYFSVPHQLIGQQVTVLYSNKVVKIYHKGEQVATHVGPYPKYSTQADHMGSTHREYLNSINPDMLMKRGFAIDVNVGKVIEHLLGRPLHPEQNYKSCQGVLSLAKKYERLKLIEACKIALAANIVGYSYIHRICSTPYSTEKPEVTSTGPLPKHENVRGNYF